MQEYTFFPIPPPLSTDVTENQSTDLKAIILCIAGFLNPPPTGVFSLARVQFL
jgi:hypothetical protein